jgi:PPOX class probable F420-dependent enzyme
VDASAVRALLATARVARLATAGADRRPHLVPICFALDGAVLYTAIDHKPKRTHELRRLRNIAENPLVSVLADSYRDDDWSALWWARADGSARILPAAGAERARALMLLAERYRQYAEQPPTGPVIAVEVARFSGWRARDG